MTWRCARCGQAHETRDPPCGNCGGHEFEWTDTDRPEPVDDGPASTSQWICTECGRGHPKHAPPCSRCGSTTLERRDVEVDPAELSAPSYRDLASRRYLLLLAVALAGLAVFGLGVVGVVDIPGMGGGGDSDPRGAPGDAAEPDGASLVIVDAIAEPSSWGVEATPPSTGWGVDSGCALLDDEPADGVHVVLDGEPTTIRSLD